MENKLIDLIIELIKEKAKLLDKINILMKKLIELETSIQILIEQETKNNKNKNKN